MINIFHYLSFQNTNTAFYCHKNIDSIMMEDDGLREKKLRGSGGYVFARISDEEQKLGNLGGPELFLAGIGRLDDDRIIKYFCNKCEKEFSSSPKINYENPNEDLGEGVKLLERGEYTCNQCNHVIAQYRKFDSMTSSSEEKKEEKNLKTEPKKLKSSTVNKINNNDEILSNSTNSIKSKNSDSDDNNKNVESLPLNRSILKINSSSFTNGSYLPIQSLLGMPVYDNDAMFVGKILEIGLNKSNKGIVQVNFKVGKEVDKDIDQNEATQDNFSISNILWSDVSKIGDIVILNINNSATSNNLQTTSNNISTLKCSKCEYVNQQDANFCEECGTKLVVP